MTNLICLVHGHIRCRYHGTCDHCSENWIYEDTVPAFEKVVGKKSHCHICGKSLGPSKDVYFYDED